MSKRILALVLSLGMAVKVIAPSTAIPVLAMEESQNVANPEVIDNMLDGDNIYTYTKTVLQVTLITPPTHTHTHTHIQSKQ